MLKTRYGPLVYAVIGLFAYGVASVEAQDDAKAKKSDADVAAYIGGEPILMKDVDAKALSTNMKLAQSMYDARKAALDDIIMERLLAKEAAAQGISVDEMVQKRVAEKTAPVTDAAVEAFFNSNKARMGGRTLEQVSGQIKSYLERQNETSARTEVLDDLKKSANVKIALDAPRAKMIIDPNDPSKGPADAKVTIVEYSDFQ